MDVCILGNHDQGALFDPGRLQLGRRAGHLLDARATRRVRSATRTTTPSDGIFWASCRATGARTASCSSTARPATRSTNTSFPKISTTSGRWKSCFHLIEQHCFQGHTHVPGVFTAEFQFLQPGGDRLPVSLTPGKDDDQRRLGRASPATAIRAPATWCWKTTWSSFAALNIRLKRRSKRFMPRSELDNFLGDRLREGR